MTSKEWRDRNHDYFNEIHRAYSKRTHRPRIPWRDINEYKPVLRKTPLYDLSVKVRRESDNILIWDKYGVAVGYYFYEDSDAGIYEGFATEDGVLLKNARWWSPMPYPPGEET